MEGDVALQEKEGKLFALPGKSPVSSLDDEVGVDCVLAIIMSFSALLRPAFLSL